MSTNAQKPGKPVPMTLAEQEAAGENRLKQYSQQQAAYRSAVSAEWLAAALVKASPVVSFDNAGRRQQDESHPNRKGGGRVG